MSTIVVFFSSTGRTRMVAQGIAEKLSAPLAEIRLTQPQASSPRPLRTHYTEADLPSISCEVTDFSPFSEIIFGGPVWAFNIAPPLLSFVRNTDLTGKTVHLFVTEFGMGGKRALRTLRKELEAKKVHLGQSKIFALTFFKNASTLRSLGERWAEAFFF